MRKRFAIVIVCLLGIPAAVALALTVSPPVATFTINGNTYTNAMLEANPAGWLGGVAADIAIVTTSITPGYPGVPIVATNAALTGLSTVTYASAIRNGFTAAGDSPSTTYTKSAAACTLAAGLGDNGSQVPSSDGKCWIASFPATGADLRSWGVNTAGNTAVDTGPAIRAACAWSVASGRPVIVPAANYWINTLDASGLGAIVIGTGVGVGLSNMAKACHFTGASGGGFPDSCGTDTPVFHLGPALNRPLVFVHPNTGAPHFTDMCLNGNEPAQSGWAGGPNGFLYTIEVANGSSGVIDSSIKLTRVVISHGYNGNLYIGGWRGVAWIRDSWSLYSGQSVTDYGIYLAGLEGYFSNFQAGVTTGSGIFVAAGSQYQFVGGASFYNTDAGMVIAGGQVQYMAVNGMNMQANGCNGIRVLGAVPLAGQNSSGHTFNNVTFEANSESVAGLCSDVMITDRPNEHFVAPLFIGRSTVAQKLPKYNIEFSGTGAAYVDSPGWGTLGATGANTLGFTNNYGRIFGNLPLEISWTPILDGTTGGGTPAYTHNVGTWGRQNQMVTATFSILTSALNAPTGDMMMTGLPLYSSLTGNNQGSCHLSRYTGWTGATGYTHLAAEVPYNNQIALFIENGSGVSAQYTPTSEFAAVTWLVGTCIYPSAVGVPQ